MLKVFSSNDLSEMLLVRDALMQNGIEATTQNQYSGSSAVPEFRAPAEIWIERDADHDAARRLVTETLAVLDSRSEAPPWNCVDCSTENPGSFELCWSCGKDRKVAD